MSSHMTNAPGRKDMKKGRPANNRNNSGRTQNKTVPEGIYTNPRFLHTATSLIGSTILLQVKNGTKYEGVLRTFSSKMEIVLDVAHMVEDTRPGQSSAPCLEQLNTVIFNLHDVVTMTAIGVDLTYANKDNFTDTAISSKHNGIVSERELKELEPWQGEDDGGHFGLEEGHNPNGWDADEMFQTNAEKFQVKTSYDDSLEQYTTPLDVKNTKEFRMRELQARQLANEIEKTDNYNRHMDLENGDMDEEEKFSAVIRDNGASGKYVPPHLRGDLRGGNNPRGRSAGRGSPMGTPPRSQNTPNRSHQPMPSPKEERLNGDDRNMEKDNRRQEKEDRRPDSFTADPLRNHPPPAPGLKVKDDTKSSPTSAAKVPVGRNLTVEKDLRDFQSNFKLSSETKEKDKERDKENEKDKKPADVEESSPSRPPPLLPTPPALAPPTTHQQAHVQPTATTPNSERAEEKPAAPVIKSKLNPDAPEFKFNPAAKPFVPSGNPYQRTNPTPPRAVQPSSPVYGYQVGYPPQPPPPQYIMMPQQLPVNPHMPPMVQQSQVAPRMPKKAIVSVRQGQDFVANQAAAAATGQPLQMPPPQQPSHYVQYPQQMVPQGVQQQMFNPTTFRMLVPTSMQQNAGGNEQGNGQTPAVMMGPPGGNPGVQPMPAHIQYPGGMPQHHHTPPHSQAGTPQNHPAPSPIQQHPHPQQPQQQTPHPPPSGTPQNIIYTNSSQPPPLQPSPHTPASPQAPHPPHMQPGYHYSHPPHSSAQSNHITQSMPSQAPQYIMMPHSQHPSQTQGMMPSPYQHLPHGTYRAPSPQVAGQHQMMTHSVPSSGAGMPAPMHYMPQHQMQGPVTPLQQSYHPPHQQ